MSGEATEAEANRPADLGRALQVAIARIYSRFRSERGAGEIGEATLAVLMQLRKRGPLSLTELSERARVTPGSMSQSVNRLDKAGYLVRNRDPADKRRVLFTLTPEGDAIATAARNHRQTWLDGQLAALDSRQRAVLAEAAELLTAIAEAS